MEVHLSRRLTTHTTTRASDVAYSTMTQHELHALCNGCNIDGIVATMTRMDVVAPAQSEPASEGVQSVCVRCPEGVIAGALITKEKRQELFGRVAGGAGSGRPEEFQRQAVIDGTGVVCPKTNVRINLRTNRLRDVSHPNTKNDGFDYSEDFDGSQSVGGNTVYVNLKCIVGKGGSQTRSLREVYWFVEGQLRTLRSVDGVYFANILDGDEADVAMPKFDYLLRLPAYGDVRTRVYVGDLKGYFDWFRRAFVDGSCAGRSDTPTQMASACAHTPSIPGIAVRTDSNFHPASAR